MVNFICGHNLSEYNLTEVNLVGENFRQSTKTSSFSRQSSFVWPLPVTVKLTSCSSCLLFSFFFQYFAIAFANHEEKTCLFFCFFNQTCCEWTKCFKTCKGYKSVSKVNSNAFICYWNVFIHINLNILIWIYNL